MTPQDENTQECKWAEGPGKTEVSMTHCLVAPATRIHACCLASPEGPQAKEVNSNWCTPACLEHSPEQAWKECGQDVRHWQLHHPAHHRRLESVPWSRGGYESRREDLASEFTTLMRIEESRNNQRHAKPGQSAVHSPCPWGSGPECPGKVLHLSCERYPPALPSSQAPPQRHQQSQYRPPIPPMLRRGPMTARPQGTKEQLYPGAWFEMQLDQIFSLILEICRESSGSPTLVLQSELGQNSNSLLILKKKKR